jgi:hypothetical protein
MEYDDGLQTRSGGLKALAPPPGIRTDSKGRYWQPLRRPRRTIPTGRLIKHFNGDAPVFDTSFDNISGLDSHILSMLSLLPLLFPRDRTCGFPHPAVEPGSGSNPLRPVGRLPA